MHDATNMVGLREQVHKECTCMPNTLKKVRKIPIISDKNDFFFYFFHFEMDLRIVKMIESMQSLIICTKTKKE